MLQILLFLASATSEAAKPLRETVEADETLVADIYEHATPTLQCVRKDVRSREAPSTGDVDKDMGLFIQALREAGGRCGIRSEVVNASLRIKAKYPTLSDDVAEAVAEDILSHGMFHASIAMAFDS